VLCWAQVGGSGSVGLWNEICVGLRSAVLDRLGYGMRYVEDYGGEVGVK